MQHELLDFAGYEFIVPDKWTVQNLSHTCQPGLALLPDNSQLFVEHCHFMQAAIITHYGSTVYIGMAMGGSALKPYIRKFQFSISISIQSVF